MVGGHGSAHFVGESDAPAKFGALLAMGTDGIVEVRRG